MARDLMAGDLTEIHIAYDAGGSLATTHECQGADMGLFGGLLGWEAADDRLTSSAAALRSAGIRVDIRVTDFGAEHPNTCRLTLKNDTERHTMTAVSTGGGMVEVIEIDGAGVSMAGDFYETLVYTDSDGKAVEAYLIENLDVDQVSFLQAEAVRFVEVKSQRPLEPGILSALLSRFAIDRIQTIGPVLPVLSRRQIAVPFFDAGQMLAYSREKQLDLWEAAAHYEGARGGISHREVFDKMRSIVGIMEAAVEKGLRGTHYKDRILGYQSGAFLSKMEGGQLMDGGLFNRMILFATATMEVKSAMGGIVAAPTAGACGILPGAVLGAAREMGLSVDHMVRAMLAAGMIGVLIAARSTFAAEVCGCQAECGAGSGMAAAALVQLAGGNIRQAVDAASMALQNVFGMTCDPVANRVEVPCLGKNIMAVGNALACANMALAGFDPVIPLDEVIDAMDRVGKKIPHELRCTALGGLSVTETSRKIEKKFGRLDEPLKVV